MIVDDELQALAEAARRAVLPLIGTGQQLVLTPPPPTRRKRKAKSPHTKPDATPGNVEPQDEPEIRRTRTNAARLQAAISSPIQPRVESRNPSRCFVAVRETIPTDPTDLRMQRSPFVVRTATENRTKHTYIVMDRTDRTREPKILPGDQAIPLIHEACPETLNGHPSGQGIVLHARFLDDDVPQENG